MTDGPSLSAARGKVLSAEMDEGPRTSDLLLQLTEGARDGDRMTLGDLLTRFGDRSFGVLVVLLSIPTMVPGPPGFGGIFGVILGLFGVQIAAGRSRPWLPAVILRRSFRVTDLAIFVRKAAPYIARFERVCRPRLPALQGPATHRLLGGLIVLLAIYLSLPIPFTNALPSIAFAVLGLAMIERDGVMIVLGTVLAFLMMAIITGVGFAFLEGVLLMFGGLFG